MTDQLADRQPAMRKHTGHIGAGKRINQKDQYHTDHRQPHHTAGGFNHEQNADNTND